MDLSYPRNCMLIRRNFLNRRIDLPHFGSVIANKCLLSQGVQEHKINIFGVDINYVKVGTGTRHVLLTPGALGSIWTDFKKQIEGFDKTKFTLIVWDPPGYGKSRPPDRDFPPNFLERDANFAWNLMKELNIEKYSLVGWSNGGIISIVLAAAHPENVNKLVIFGSNSYVTPEEALTYDAFRSIKDLSPSFTQPLIDLYGEEYYQKMWNGWLDACITILRGERKGDICKSALPKISCPTLILHGGKDVNIHKDHAPYIHKNIKNSRIYLIADGKHNLHIKYSEEFNKAVQDFLLQDEGKTKLSKL